jgi:hypothetical protein
MNRLGCDMKDQELAFISFRQIEGIGECPMGILRKIRTK